MAKTTTTSAKKLRDLSVEDLNLRIEDLKKQLFGLRLKATTKELTDPTEIRRTRREIARVHTILNEKTRKS